MQNDTDAVLMLLINNIYFVLQEETKQSMKTMYLLFSDFFLFL